MRGEIQRRTNNFATTLIKTDLIPKLLIGATIRFLVLPASSSASPVYQFSHQVLQVRPFRSSHVHLFFTVSGTTRYLSRVKQQLHSSFLPRGKYWKPGAHIQSAVVHIPAIIIQLVYFP